MKNDLDAENWEDWCNKSSFKQFVWLLHNDLINPMYKEIVEDRILHIPINQLFDETIKTIKTTHLRKIGSYISVIIIMYGLVLPFKIFLKYKTNRYIKKYPERIL